LTSFEVHSPFFLFVLSLILLFNIIVFLIANKINKSQTIKDTLTNVENIENLVN